MRGEGKNQQRGREWEEEWVGEGMKELGKVGKHHHHSPAALC